jgi:hypothetical protein
MTADAERESDPAPSPWPPTPSWGFAAFTVAVMLLAVFLVWLSNWLEVRKIREREAKASSPAAATTSARNP